ncbi:protein-L-isoaspartate O-methyltransferase-like [Nymphaea colorata]|nr:protein-L-isoaspartate O-methyltransferase-like [Nymphaea colorata]
MPAPLRCGTVVRVPLPRVSGHFLFPPFLPLPRPPSRSPPSSLALFPRLCCCRIAGFQSGLVAAALRLSPKMELHAGGDFEKNKQMVRKLQLYGVAKSKRVTEVMETVDRGWFVPPGNDPYLDSPMPIGYNATISAPHMHATCLELLQQHLQPGMHALDVGSGTGYLTACFALMVGSGGRAVGVEHIPELVAISIENIKRSAAAPLLEQGVLSVHVGDGREGSPHSAPYDAIHVGASAPEIPAPLVAQLKPGGRMVIPVGDLFQQLKVVDKRLDGSLSVRTETSVSYVPLTSRAAQLQDS